MKKLILFFKSRLTSFALRREGFLNDDPETNGEYFHLHELVESSERDPLILFDVGANVGDWSYTAITAAKNRRVELHAFEPGTEAYRQLCNRWFPKIEGIVLNNLALDKSSGFRTLEVSKVNNKLSCLVSSAALATAGSAYEGVKTTTVDEYCRMKSIDRIFFMKIDVEGAEFDVLKGCYTMLKEGRILNLQFEYGGTYLRTETKLIDVVSFLRIFGYRVGRIMPRSIKWCGDREIPQDSYQYSNWFATRRTVPNKSFRY